VKKDLLLPLTGVAFILLAIASFTVGGEPPDADDPVQEIVDFYVDDRDSIFAGVYLLGLATVSFIFFANYLRTVFHGTRASATILVGAAIFVVGAAIDGTLLIAMAEAADNEVPPESIQTLQALWDNDFLPFAIGITVFTISVGVSILRTAVLPRWLGWVTLVVALVSVIPLVGFFAFPLTGLLILVLSVMLTVRARGAGTPPSATPPAPAAPPPPV
jgi:hypothetical protein